MPRCATSRQRRAVRCPRARSWPPEFGLPGSDARRSARVAETTAGHRCHARRTLAHSETAWRLRHIRRSILKDEAPIVSVVETGRRDRSAVDSLGRAMGSAASLATTFFTDLPFSGEVNLLTTGAIGPGGFLGRNAAARRRLHGDRRADRGGRLVGARRDEPGRPVLVDRCRRIPVPRRGSTRLPIRLLVQRAGLSRRESRRARSRCRRQPKCR